MENNKTVINIYVGNNQVLPNVKEVEQHIHTKDGKTTIINKLKYDDGRIHKAQRTSSSAERDCCGISQQDY